METIAINDSAREQWEEFVLRHPDSIAWQTYDWSRIVKKHYPVIFYPLAVRDGSSIRGILPLYYVKPRFRKDGLISVPYAVAGGIAANDESAASELLEQASDLSREHGGCGITLKQYKKKMAGDLRTDENFYNRELQLTEDLDALFRSFDERNRRRIEQAERLGFQLEYPSADVNSFYSTLLRGHHRRGIPCASQSWIADLLELGMYSIAVLRRQGRIAAGTMVKEFKKTVSFPFTCASAGGEGGDLPIYALYWSLIKRFAMEGKEIFHSGRIPKTDQADGYRLGWGGVKYNYYYQYYPNSNVKTEYVQKRGGKRRVLEFCWKRMPRGLAGVLGPSIVREYP